MGNEILNTVPANFHFHFGPKKQNSCSVHLINKIDNHVNLTNKKKYGVRRNAGVVLIRDNYSGAHTMNRTARRSCNEAGHRVYKTKLGVASVDPLVQEGSEDDFGCVIGSYLDILLICSPFSLLLCFPIYCHLLQPHAPLGSSTKTSVSENENYSHLSDTSAFSFITKGISPPQPQVFINFRGAELRNTFVGFLAKAMRLEKINVFTDEVEVRGTTLNSLFTRIEASKVAVAIFSERYTESSWCLDELVKMIEQMEHGKLVVIPVFYKVNPSACAYLEGTFGDRFRKLEWEYRSEPERVKKWKEALSSVSRIMGVKLDAGSDESKFVDIIVEEVKKVLIKINTDKDKVTDFITGSNKTFIEERNDPFILSRTWNEKDHFPI